jgi:tricorn protease
MYTDLSIRSSLVAVFLAAATLLIGDATAAQSALLRFPDVHADTVVFVHAEDIWTAPITGGVARRLTDDEGEERHPKFSPDGSLIAFTASIDGNPDVYVMSSSGGGISRLTHHPSTDEVVGWHPRTNKVLFRSSRSSGGLRFEQLYLVSPDGTGLERLPLHEAARGSFSPDGKMIAYNRIAREHRTWKRYDGGTAQDLWLEDFSTSEDRRLTDFSGTDRLPMWIGDRIYFASDRDGTLNIYSYDLATEDIEQLTHHTDYDARRPSHGSGRIVYELGGELWLFDTSSSSSTRIPIEITTVPRETRPYLRNVADSITEVGISPAGGRALVVARGEVFTVPREHGAIRNLSRSIGTRERNAAWSPDGTQIAFFSDRSGEYQLHLGDPLGQEEPHQITNRELGYPHTPRWSPDGERIAFTDETLTLYFVELDSGKVVSVDRAEVEPMDVALEAKPISDFAWSPDGSWLAYSKIGVEHVSKIWIYSLATGERHNLSSGLFNDFGPVFSPNGEHLLFISNRNTDPILCDLEWEMVYKRMAGIYALTLRADGPALLPPRSDELAPFDDDEDHGHNGDKGDDGDDAPIGVRIDVDGITDRIQALPVEPGNYRQLALTSEAVYYLNGDRGDFNRFEYRSLPPLDLYSFDLEDRDQDLEAAKVDSYALSSDGSHIAIRQIIDLETTDKLRHYGRTSDLHKAGHGLDLSRLSVLLDPVAEWKQVFWEAWRLERDFFYDPDMHGFDWSELGRKYGRLLDGISCAQDLRFLIGELIGELATSHTYIRVGDRRREAAGVKVGMLGADWEVESRRYRLAKVYRVPHWNHSVIPPLSGPGIQVHEGDYLISVNGVDIEATGSIYAHFQGLAGQSVRLVFSDRPEGGDRREVITTPISSERHLRYLDWVERNRRVVDEASDGRIGYLHLPDTYTGSAVEFGVYYYAQTRKQGLLIDGRFNNGGLDPDMFLNRLAKRPLSYWTRRYSEDQVTPVYVSRAHMALLTNRQAGSGGDELPLEFRQKGMGPVIGTRTWGGLVGVSMSISLQDGSRLTAPDYRIYTTDGRWTVENEGVTPDILVELEPAEMARGWDAQLQKGIEYLMQKIEEDPVEPPAHPPFPTTTLRGE